MKGSSDKESGYVGKTKVAGEKKKSEDICEIAVLWCSPRCSATGGGCLIIILMRSEVDARITAVTR